MGTPCIRAPVGLLIALIVVALALPITSAQAQGKIAREGNPGSSAPAGVPGGKGLLPLISSPLRLIHSAHIPENYVLRIIICDTAVYDAAGGSPVAGALVRAGQTWFVNPKPKKVNGESWTRIYVGGRHTGWIPSRCVGDAPPGY